MSPDDTQIITKTTATPSTGGNWILNENLSGRFWIAFILTNWLGISTILILMGSVKIDSNAAIAIYTGFSGGALSLIGIYMGQHQKKESTTSTTVTSVPQNGVK